MKPTQLPDDPNRALSAEIDHQAPAERIIRALTVALEATTTTRSGTVEPDHRTRVAAASKLLEYRIGRPVERQEIVSVNLDADSALGLADRLKNSPALRQAIRAALDSAEGET
jgi:hypothetical protein